MSYLNCSFASLRTLSQIIPDKKEAEKFLKYISHSHKPVMDSALIVVGEAGTGKTTLLKGICTGFKEFSKYLGEMNGDVELSTENNIPDECMFVAIEKGGSHPLNLHIPWEHVHVIISANSTENINITSGAEKRPVKLEVVHAASAFIDNFNDVDQSKNTHLRDSINLKGFGLGLMQSITSSL